MSLLPGITGVASLRFCDEEVLLAKVGAEQVEEFYVSTLLPEKVELEIAYARHAGFLCDVILLFRTAAAVLR